MGVSGLLLLFFSLFFRLPVVSVENIGFCDGIRCYGLLQQTTKQLTPTRRCPAIETKSEFLQVRLEVFRRKCSLMSAEQPTLQQSSNPMNSRHRNVSRIVRRGQNCLLMLITLRQSIIASPTIGTNNAVRSNHFTNKRQETSADASGI